MRSIVIYESIYGNTRRVAEAIAEGLGEARALPVADVDDRLLADGRSAAAFDTRIDRSPALVGSAARGIARRLRHRGYELAAEPESFFVDDAEGPLAEGELDRARAWGQTLAT
jgi:hypothetical protein